jgi:hypothetical protein
MSTKIYDAYRLKGEGLGQLVNFWKLTDEWLESGIKEAYKALNEFEERLASNIELTSAEYKKQVEYFEKLKSKDPDFAARHRMAIDIMVKEYKKQLSSHERSLFDFNVSITFRHHCRRIYVQCYADMHMKKILDFVRNDPRVEDYHYQNSSDQPEEISERDWKKREEVWDKIYENEGRRRFLALDIMNHSEFGYWRVTREIELADKIKEL